jgi:hypothetical protein
MSPAITHHRQIGRNIELDLGGMVRHSDFESAILAISIFIRRRHARRTMALRANRCSWQRRDPGSAFFAKALIFQHLCCALWTLHRLLSREKLFLCVWTNQLRA